MNAKHTSGIVVGGKKPRRFGLHSRLAVLAAGSLALISLVVVGALWATGQFNTDSEHSTDSSTRIATQQKVDQAVNNTVTKPDYAAAKTALLAQLDNASSQADRIKIYNGLTAIAVQQKQYQQVIDNGLMASKLDTARAGLYAVTIADAYAALGNKTEALKYYKQALDYYTAQSDKYSGKVYYVNDINSKMAELQK